MLERSLEDLGREAGGWGRGWRSDRRAMIAATTV